MAGRFQLISVKVCHRRLRQTGCMSSIVFRCCRLCLPALFALLAGCASVSSQNALSDVLLPSSSSVSKSPFDSYEAARDALEKTVPYQTTLAELKELGFDPDATANVTVIPYPEVVSRLAPYSGVALDALDPGVRDCILAQTRCVAYVFRFGRNDRQRNGNVVLDFFNFQRQVHMTGWQFEGMVVVRSGVVLFRNVAGEPRLDTQEKTTNPLGPLQRSGESSDLLLR